MENYAQAFRDDGVVHIRGILSADDMALVEAAYRWKMDNPGNWGSTFYADSGANFFQANGDSSAEPAFRAMLQQTPIADIVAALFREGPVWYMEEQLFYKEAAAGSDGTRRTPWHQDISYEPMSGEKTAVVWIGLDEVSSEHALEVVRGSHRGSIYNATRFDAADDTAPFFDHPQLPRLPDIQKDRDSFDIVSWPSAPGDLLIFSYATLHGGGGTPPGGRRRSLTLRFVGDDTFKIDFPRTADKSQATGEEAARISRPPSHLDRFWALPIGAPIADCCPTRVRG